METKTKILHILYDLSQVLCSELEPNTLITKFMLKIMQHTDYPVALFFSRLKKGENEHNRLPDIEKIRLIRCIGSYKLKKREGEILEVPAVIIQAKIGLEEQVSMPESLCCSGEEIRHMLRLPVGQEDLILLLSPTKMTTDIPLDHIFQPVLNNFSNMLNLIRTNEHSKMKLENEIKSRKKFEKELIYSQELRKKIVNSFEDEIALIKTDDMTILEINESLNKKYSISRNQIIGQSCYKIFHGLKSPCSSDHHICVIKSATEKRIKVQTEHSHIDDQGKAYAHKIIGTPVIDSQGKVNQVVYVSRDITERKMTHDKLLQFKNILDSSIDSIFLTDRRTMKFIDANKKGCQMLGYQLSELLEMGPQDIKPYHSMEEMEKKFDKILESDEGIDVFETVHETKDKKQYPVEISVSAHKSRNSSIMVSIARDITERKEKEEYNRLLIDNFPMGLAERRINGDLISINNVYAEIIGRTIEETLGLTYWEITPEDYADQEKKQLDSLEKTGQYGPYVKEYIHKDGHRVPVRLRGILLTRRNEKFIWSTVEDITEEIHTKEELQIAKNKAEAAVKIKNEFLANMSHEIRTPMNSVLGFLEIALEDESLNHQLRKYLSTARISAVTLLGVINDILDISKLESGKLTIEKNPFRLSRMMKEIQSTMSILARDKGLYLQIDIHPSLSGFINSDQMRIRQILLNLVGNAIKFTKDGGVEVRIVPADEKRHIHFIIRDTGIGIPADRLNKIFKPFIQADASTTRHYGGTGLGVTISKHLVELMEGEIWVESEKGKGSTFHFTLPVPSHNQVPENGDLHAASDITIFSAPHKNLQVLLVEDVEANMELATYRLMQHGHKVTAAWNGHEAVEIFQQGGIDLILMDIQMPIMGGIEATKRIRELEADTGRYTPIIALTAAVMKQETEKYLDAGMDAVVAKPIKFEKLFAIMENVISKGIGKKISIIRTADHTIGQPEMVPEQTAQNLFSASDLPGISIENGMKRVSGNKKLYKKLLTSFKDQYAAAVDEIKTYLKEDDVEGAAHLIHTVKGVSSNLGAEKLFHLAEDMEKVIKRGETDQLDPLLTSFEHHLHEVMRGIGAFEQKQAQKAPEEVPGEMKPIDKKTILPQLTEMGILLKSDFMEAMNLFEELKPHLENSEIFEELKLLEKQFERFDTGRALETLKEIVKKLTLSTGEND